MPSQLPAKPPQPWSEHLRVRVGAKREQAQAQRAFNGLQRDARAELRQLRRAAKTAGIVARTRLTSRAMQACAALIAKWRRPHP
jgi:hypothetical protein